MYTHAQCSSWFTLRLHWQYVSFRPVFITVAGAGAAQKEQRQTPAAAVGTAGNSSADVASPMPVDRTLPAPLLCFSSFFPYPPRSSATLTNGAIAPSMYIQRDDEFSFIVLFYGIYVVLMFYS